MTKPPLGPLPHSIWKSKTLSLRYEEVARAICDYEDAKLSYPIEWLWELQQIIEELKVERAPKS